MSDLRNRRLALALVLAGASGCSALPWVAPEPEPLTSVTPVTDPTEVASVETADGRWSLETYRTNEGPCVDLVAPDGSLQPRCPVPDLAAVDGQGGWVILEYTRPPSDGDGVLLVNGFARPEVQSIVLTPEGMGPIEIRPSPAAGGGIAVFLAVLPAASERFEVAAYDAEGCLLQRDRHDLRPSPGAAPFSPDGDLEGPDCSEGVRRTPSAGEPSP